MPIFNITNIGPGNSRSNDVTITNSGDITASFSLSKSNLSETPGPGGGALSDWLNLTVQDLTTGKTVYSGRLSSMPTRDAGTITPKSSHLYRFVVSFPDIANGSLNPYEQSSLSVEYDWTATDVRLTDVLVTAPSNQLPLKARAAYVMIQCNARCTVNATAQITISGSRVARRGLKLQPVSRQLEAGVNTKLVFPLQKSTLKRVAQGLARHKKVRLKVGLAIIDEAGATRQLNRTVTLVGSKSPRRR